MGWTVHSQTVTITEAEASLFEPFGHGNICPWSAGEMKSRFDGLDEAVSAAAETDTIFHDRIFDCCFDDGKVLALVFSYNGENGYWALNVAMLSDEHEILHEADHIVRDGDGKPLYGLFSRSHDGLLGSYNFLDGNDMYQVEIEVGFCNGWHVPAAAKPHRLSFSIPVTVEYDVCCGGEDEAREVALSRARDMEDHLSDFLHRFNLAGFDVGDAREVETARHPS